MAGLSWIYTTKYYHSRWFTMSNANNKALMETIQADIYRNVHTRFSIMKLVYYAIFERNVAVRFLIWFRLAQNAEQHKKPFRKTVLWIFKKLSIRYNYEISPKCQIGKGLRLPHYAGGVVIHPNAVIGENCEIMQGVTIGNNIMKSRDKVAVIGDNVILASGCKIIGEVTIGDSVVIGANSVVSKDIGFNVIAAGVPAHVIRQNTAPVIINVDHKKEEMK